MQMTDLILSLFVNGCNDCFKETCELGHEALFVCVLCGIGRQQAMGGYGHSMEGWKVGRCMTT
jgi:hypothetical protein